MALALGLFCLFVAAIVLTYAFPRHRAQRWLRLAPLGLVLAALAGCDVEPREPWEPVRQGDATVSAAALDEADLVGSNHTPPGCSAFLVGALIDVPFGAMACVAVVLASVHRRRARAERALDPGAPLRDGVGMVEGVVVVEPGSHVPVQVRISQTGTEQSTKNGTSHTWRETGREVRAQPFCVRRADGLRVRVEPGTSVRLLGASLGTERNSAEQRVRIASLVAGDKVRVGGDIEGAAVGQGPSGGVYRRASSMPVMRPSRGAPLTITLRAARDDEAAAARFHGRAAAALAAIFMFFSLVFARDFQLLALDGRVLLARPTHTRTWREWMKPKNKSGYWVRRYALRAEVVTPSGRTVTVEDGCGERAHQCAAAGDCHAVPFLVSSWAPEVHQIGRRPMLSTRAPALLSVFGFALAIIYPLIASVRRPWYARRRLVEEGNGPLRKARR